VCLRAVDLVARRLPTRRTLARGPGCVHIPCSGAEVTARGPRQPPYVSATTGSRINLVPMAAVSPGAGPPAQSGAGHWSSATSTILGRRPSRSTSGRASTSPHGSGIGGTQPMRSARARIGSTWRSPYRTGWRGRRRHPVGGADRGNQPIHRRVDTISKQYQVSSTTRDASHDGGGAPWES
jgi:hypothetical protein